MVNLVDTEQIDEEEQEIEDDAEELLQEAVQLQGGVAAVTKERREPIVYLATTMALTRDLLARLQPAERVEILEPYCRGCGEILEEDDGVYCVECSAEENNDLDTTKDSGSTGHDQSHDEPTTDGEVRGDEVDS